MPKYFQYDGTEILNNFAALIKTAEEHNDSEETREEQEEESVEDKIGDFTYGPLNPKPDKVDGEIIMALDGLATNVLESGNLRSAELINNVIRKWAR